MAFYLWPIILLLLAWPGFLSRLRAGSIHYSLVRSINQWLNIKLLLIQISPVFVLFSYISKCDNKISFVQTFLSKKRVKRMSWHFVKNGNVFVSENFLTDFHLISRQTWEISWLSVLGRKVIGNRKGKIGIYILSFFNSFFYCWLKNFLVTR